MIIGLLGYTSTVLRAGADDTDAVIELYAAEAGITEVKNLLLEEGSSITTPSVLDPLDVGGLPVEVSITSPLAPAHDTPQYVNPLLHIGSGDESYVFTIKSVRLDTRLQVNWAYSPDTSTSTINVYRGQMVDIENLIGTSATTTPSSFTINPTVASVYTVEFRGNAATEIQSAQFSPAGDTSTTWVYVSSYRDYVVTSRSGATTITAYLRQIPGPTVPPVPQQVYTLSWKPHE